MQSGTPWYPGDMQSVHFLPITLSLHEHIPYLSHASDMEPWSLQTQAKNEIIHNFIQYAQSK